jgi:glutathione synthase/RimK-type ligase-like ATP-grasp enzyme
MSNEARRAWGGVLNSSPSITWVNHPLAISAASYKPEQLARAKRLGFAVPDSLITNNPERARGFYNSHGRCVIAKPIGHGEVLATMPQDDRIIYTNVVGPDEVPNFELVANCPTFFQQSITKEADVRVTVVGNSVFAVDLWSQDNTWSSVDCRRENMRDMRYQIRVLPTLLEESLISLVRSYDLLFGAIDLIRDRAGKYWFLELNPAGQWAWLEQLGYGEISQALISILSGESKAPIAP